MEVMELTDEIKKEIDEKSYSELLRRNRFAPIGDPWFGGKTGRYWLRRMAELRDLDPEGAVKASKQIGWDK